MTVAEAAAAGKTAEYNQLVSGYFPGGVVQPLDAGGGKTYSQLATTPITAITNKPPVVVPEEKKTPVPPVTTIPTVTTTNEDTTAKDNLTAVTDEIKKLYEDKPSSEQAYYDAEKKAGLEAKRQEVQNYSDQQDVIIAERDAAIQQIRNQSSVEGGTVGILSAREDALNRSANIKLLPIQAKLAAAQGNLELAQERLNTIFDLMMKDAEQTFNRDMKILEVSYDYMNNEQKNKADEIKQDKQNSFTLFNNKINAIQSMANDALKDNPTLAAKLMEYAGSLNLNTITTTDTNSELSRIMKNYGVTSGGGTGTEAEGVISPYQEERLTRNLQSIQDLKPRATWQTVGVFGKPAGYLPGTVATDFKNDVNTLIANITFGELTAMREASKTGGALGQVSDRENQLLGAALGSLNTSQSPASFRKNLQKIEDSINRWKTVMLQSSGGGTSVTAPNGEQIIITD